MVTLLRDVRKQELKEHIFMQALQLFKEKGFENVTVEEITKACGIAKGTFYNYFPKKEAILLHLGKTQLESFYQGVIRYADEPDLKKKLTLLFHNLFARYREHSDLIRLVILELMRSTLHIQEEMGVVQKFLEAIMSILDDAKKSGQLSEHMNTEDVAAVLMGIYFNSLMVWLSQEADVAEIENIFQRQFEIVWQGICHLED
ncbi:transcriptional regulator, TetR family [Brevibacillus laterosporus LMG 15441]|uniref:Transcriptional regulator, TetR family n=1 Tax=Brevibacillus laterosporus LMG 15441 TaxID=1042163 RepID=A0A075R9R4_BRELA|nr:transcriptional regulator, TetR family [Brevibacillus laterosporus LMG 15441]